ncbi:MAG: hypothetical protein KVP17_001758 [Porospora cf. gigantea B]|nr:MAG: hypothetical protein KVP17_001758 [Porospora cf. gigantea B]
MKGKTVPSNKTCTPALVPKNEADASEWEEQHVHSVYSVIAKHFSNTRYKPWPRVQRFLDSLASGSVVFDIGCGNGKYSLRAADKMWMGSDRTRGLLECCQEKHLTMGLPSWPPLVVEDMMHTAYRPAVCDAIIAIAVLHHISTEERRRAALVELARLLRPGGRMLLYVWAKEQGNDSVGGREFAAADCFVPWHLQEKLASGSVDGSGVTESGLRTFQRYYHVFSRQEIDELQCPGLTMDDVVFDKNNWAVYYTKCPQV